MSGIVPLGNDVAVVVVVARSTQGHKEKVTCDGTGKVGGVEFVKDRERNVDPLDDLGVAHRHVRIGRGIGDGVGGEAVAYTKEVEADGVVDNRGAEGSVLLDW